MAVVTRESGAWKSVHEALRQESIQLENISDLPQMLKVQKDTHAEAVKVFEKGNKELQEQFNNAIEKLSKEYGKLAESIREKFDREVKKLDEQMEVTQNRARELRKKDIFSRLLHLGAIATFWREENQIKSKRQKLLRVMEKEVGIQKKIYTDKKQKFSQKNSEYQLGLERKVKMAQERVSVIEGILQSGIYHGAIAELRMIDLLSKLPGNYYVVNDAMLRLDRSVHFDGEWLSSSQIDHLVVGPAGIFVIEVKNWSKKFSSEGDYFDPYQQVKRHNYVCYTLLNGAFRTTVRSIIAYAGHIPAKPDSSYAKVLPIEKVNDYILWFKDVKHDTETIREIVRFIENEIE
jgi:hypothetical protein